MNSYPRVENRWDTYLTNANISDVENNAFTISILDISKKGLRAKVSNQLNPNEKYNLSIVVDKNIIHIKAIMVWQNNDYYCGFKIIESDKNWDDLVEHHIDNIQKLIA